MKRIIFMFALLGCIQQVTPMRRAGRAITAVAIGSAPVVVPGSYYIVSMKQKMDQCIDCVCAFDPMTPIDSRSNIRCLDCLYRASDPFTNFCNGVFWGALPGVNLLCLLFRGPSFVVDDICGDDIEYRVGGQDVLDKWRRQLAKAIGFLSGSSLYASLPTALYFALRKMPK